MFTSGNSSGTLPIQVRDSMEQSLLALTVLSKCKCMIFKTNSLFFFCHMSVFYNYDLTIVFKKRSTRKIKWMVLRALYFLISRTYINIYNDPDLYLFSSFGVKLKHSACWSHVIYFTSDSKWCKVCRIVQRNWRGFAWYRYARNQLLLILISG